MLYAKTPSTLPIALYTSSYYPGTVSSAAGAAFSFNFARPSATFTAAASALFSASLVPTVCSLPKSQVSFRMRVSERMSSAARTWWWGFSESVRKRTFLAGLDICREQ